MPRVNVLTGCLSVRRTGHVGECFWTSNFTSSVFLDLKAQRLGLPVTAYLHQLVKSYLSKIGRGSGVFVCPVFYA